MMLPIEKLPTAFITSVLGLLFDIDDTFTTHGKIHATAFQALWALKDTGLKVVPITGRPAGWCDHIARMWPVDGVVGENGAFYFWYDKEEGKLKKRFIDPDEVREEKRRRLEEIREEVLISVPGTAVASDQHYREADLAIDYCEDVPPLEWEAVEKIGRIFENHGANFKVSSVHVNGWFGDYDKLGMTKLFSEEQWGIHLDDEKGRFLFCGDSPNDEPMFAYFPHTAAVRNIIRFADRMTHLPRFVASREGGEGFAEIVKIILTSLGFPAPFAHPA
jgi:HAD superfamily hydrolase (TIGR01484 family)